MGGLSELNVKVNSIVIILLGLIACLFPMFTTMTIGMISGFAFFMIAISLLLFGMSIFSADKLAGIITIVLAFIAIFFSLSLIFSPGWASSFISFIVYFVGLLMIVTGISHIFVGKEVPNLNYMGYVSIILGVIYIIIGLFVANPIFLGVLVGVWLILFGIFTLLTPSIA